MKTIIITLSLALFGGVVWGDTGTLTSTVQRGLFEEEVNRDFRAAISAYEAALERFDRDRQLAATAAFRLAENYRRAGRIREAEALYERVVREFHDQTELARLAAGHLPDERLNALGAGISGVLDDEEEQEVERLRQILENSPDEFFSHPGEGGSALNRAIRIGHMRVVEFIIDRGFDVRSPWRSTDSQPLHVAAHSRNKPAVELLLNAGVDADIRDNGDNTPLHSAARSGFLPGAEVLLENAADVNARNRGGETPLMLASERNYIRLIELFLEYGADVTVAREDGTTPLHEAVRHRFPRVVERLLEQGADVYATNNGLALPLDYVPVDATDPVDREIHEILRRHGWREDVYHAVVRSRGEEGQLIFWDRAETMTLTQALAEAGAELEDLGGIRIIIMQHHRGGSRVLDRPVLDIPAVLRGDAEDIELGRGMIFSFTQDEE